MVVYKNGFQLYLQGILEQRKRVRAGYSLRALARDVKVSPSQLSLLLAGKRFASLSTLERVLKLTQAPARLAEDLVSELRTRRYAQSDSGALVAATQTVMLGMEQMSVLNSWLPFAVLETLRLDQFSGQTVPSIVKPISEILGVDAKEVQNAFQSLERVGYLKDARASFELIKGVVLYPEGPPQATVRTYHQQILNRLIESIDLVSMDERINHSSQIPIDLADLPQIRKKIEKFHQSLIRQYARSCGSNELLTLSTAGKIEGFGKMKTKGKKK